LIIVRKVQVTFIKDMKHEWYGWAVKQDLKVFFFLKTLLAGAFKSSVKSWSRPWSIIIFFLRMILNYAIKTQTKELSLCHKLWFSNTYIFAIQWCRPQIFQTINSVRSNNQSLKYLRFTVSGFKDIGIRKFSLLQRLNSFNS